MTLKGRRVFLRDIWGSKEKVDELTRLLESDGYEVISGPRTTGDGYYESCVTCIEGNQIEFTV